MKQSKVANLFSCFMDDESLKPNPELRKLFPNLSEKDFREVEETFHGYLEIAWKIFKRLEAEGRFTVQEKPDPKFESPRGSALF